MIKILEVIIHGNRNNTTKLDGETIKCPECETVRIWFTNYFDVKVETDNQFRTTCHTCGCKFLMEVE